MHSFYKLSLSLHKMTKVSKHNIIRIFLTLVALLWLTTAYGSSRNVMFSSYAGLPTEKLMKIAAGYSDRNIFNDTTLVCYTLVANRYSADMPVEQQRVVVKALVELWRIYFFLYYDYAKCFEYLGQARDIAQRIGYEHPSVFLGLGCMYQTVSEESNTTSLGVKALEYYKQAYRVSLSIGDDKHADMAFTNVVQMAYTLGRLNRIGNDWKSYERLRTDNPTSVLRQYNRELYRAVVLASAGQQRQAISILDNQIRIIQPTEYARLLYFTYILKSRLLAQLHDYSAALSSLAEPKRIAEQYAMKDCMLEVFSLLSDYYLQVGNKQQHQLYRNQFVNLKDTLTSYRQLASVKEMESQTQIRALNAQVEQINAKRRRTNRLLLVLVVGAVVVIAFSCVLVYHNKRLRESNRTLYEKNRELLEARPAAPRTKPEKEKTVDSNDPSKDLLLQRIMQVVENSEEIYHPDFSIEQLAQMVGSRYRYVSQVIHERFQCNFNTFINKYRIREACLKMEDTQNYGNWTLEAIYNSVGFRSRSSFVTAFKRETGLTPSNYLQLASEHRQKELASE
jgi:AraC-like DNA-binding protein